MGTGNRKGQIPRFIQRKELCVPCSVYERHCVHSEQYVTEGTNAKEPSKPESKDKVFKNWSGSFENVREDLIIKAVFASEEVEVEEPTEEKPDKEEEVTVDDNKDKEDDKNLQQVRQ